MRKRILTVLGVAASLTAVAIPGTAVAKDSGSSKAVKSGANGLIIPFGPADRVDGGATTLKLDPGAAAALTSLGIAASPIAPATAGPDGLAFPIVSGRLDPQSAAGRLRHEGGIRLDGRRGRAVTLTDFRVETGRISVLWARVNGRLRLPILRLVTGGASVTNGATSIKVSGVQAHLTFVGAIALNRAFHVRAFKRGLKLGDIAIDAQKATINLTGGQTELALDPAAAAALTGLGVSVAPAAPATATPAGALAFPIVRGALATKTLAGRIRHEGGITLSAGEVEVTVSDFVIDTTRGVLTADLGGTRVDLLTLDLSAPQVTVDGTTVTVGNVGASLTAGAAAALNEAFDTDALAAGFKLGVATVRGDTA